MKAIIIDDEPLARSIVREYLQSYPQIELVQECNDGFEGVKAINQEDCSFCLQGITCYKHQPTTINLLQR